MSVGISFRVDEDTAAAIDRQAAAAGLTRSEFLRQLAAGRGPGGGVWVVGYYQEPPHSIHATEIEALREHANGYGQEVFFWPWGEKPQASA